MRQEQRTHGIFIFILLALYTAYEGMLRVSPAIMQKQLAQSVNISPDALGLMGAFTLYIYLIMQVPIGVIYDRISTRYVIPGMIFICALGAFFFGWSYNVGFASLAKGMMAVSSPFAFLGSLIVAQRWFEHRHFALLAGTSQAVGSLGILIAGVPVEALLQYYTSWRVVMVVLGSLGIVLALMCLMVVQDRPNEEEFHPPPPSYYRKQLKGVFSSSQTWWAAFYAFCGWGPMLVFVGPWGGPYLQKRFLISIDKAAGMFSLSWLALVVASPFLGWLSDRLGRRLPILRMSSLLGILCSLLLLYLPGKSLFVFGVLLFGLGVAASGQILTFPIVKEITSSTSMGLAVGLNNMAAVLGGIISQGISSGILHFFPSVVNTYSLTAFRVAFIIVPFLFVASYIVSTYCLKETYCKQIGGSHNHE